jgi:pimeloyl-ACP methyl ester carboxylesterase
VRDACYNRQPELVKSITTANTARDMESIRVALGEAKLNYLGISYGTYLGMVYADLFPDKVGRFMIDSAVDPSLRAIELTAGQYSVYEARVVDFLGRCSRARSCSFGPNSVERYDALLKKLETQPLRSDTATIDRASMESITFALVRGGLETTLARFLGEFERGNASSIPELQRLFTSGLPNVNDLLNDPDGDGMYYQVACSEGFHPSASQDSPGQKLAILTARAPRFIASAGSIANSQACVYWGQQSDTRTQPVAKAGLPPMLFFGSINDNITPSAWTRRTATQWPGSVYVQVSGAAHGVMTNNSCANEVGSVFLLSGALPTPTVCVTP